MKTLALACVAAAVLSGCAVYPAYGPYGGTYVTPAPVYVYPSVGFAYGYGPYYGGYRGYYGGYGYRGPRVAHHGGYGYRGWR